MSLSLEQRSQLFAQLAAMEKAGLPAERAWGLIRLPKRATAALAGMRAALLAGQNLALAGARQGIFDAFETRLLSAALTAGSPEPVYRRLSETYAARARRAAAMRARMALPLFIIMALFFIRPLPKLITGDLSAGAYLSQAVQPLVLLALAWFVLRAVFLAVRQAPRNVRQPVDTLLLQLPLIGNSLIRRDAMRFCEHLALLLEAGVPMFSAVPVAVDTQHYAPVQRHYASILPRLQKGMTLADSLRPLRMLGNPDLIGFVETGEGSGTLSKMLFHHAAGEAAAIDSFDEQFAEWVPRLVYGAIVAWMAWNLIQSPALRAPEL